MSKTYPVRNAFNAGEISSLVSFRSDLSKYDSACLQLSNAVPLVEGGAKKMPGTYFAGATANGGAMFTASMAGSVMTVTGVNYGVIQVGQIVGGANVAAGTVVNGSGATGNGVVIGIGATFTQATVSKNGAPNVSVSITGDGIGATAYVTWTRSAPSSNSVEATPVSPGPPDDPPSPSNMYLPTLHLSGGEGYTHATAAVFITNGSSNYPNGTNNYACSVTSGSGGGTGSGGTGTYSINTSQTVASELMQTVSNGKSRLVPFQFSTIQGAILELSAGLLRIWEGASQGSWALGLALQVPAEPPYTPPTAYVSGNVVLVGPTLSLYRNYPPTSGDGLLYVSAPYGATTATSVSFYLYTNISDSLSVSTVGSSPNQGIAIFLADATASKNTAALIQAGIRGLNSLNAGTSNFVDLSAWTVTPDPVYYSSPWILSGSGQTESWTAVSTIMQCTAANQNDQFPFAAVISGASSSLIVNSVYWQVFDANAQPPIQLVTPYRESDLFALDCSTQSADVLWVFHANYPPACIERLGPNSWQYSLSLPGQQSNGPPYRGTLDVVKTGYSALGQNITLISQANPCVLVLASSAATQPFSVGTRVYINECAGMVELNEGEFVVSSIAYGDVSIGVVDSSGTPSTISGTGWHITLLDPNTEATIDSSSYLQYSGGGFAVQVVAVFGSAGNYPACGTLYQERLCVGGSDNNPTQINGSVQDDYPDFISDPNEDDHAFQFTLVSNQVNQLLNMIGTPNALLIGTSGGVWVVQGSNGSSLTQTNVTASVQTSQGVSALQPQLVNGNAIFISRSTRIVTFLVYSFNTNEWESNDLTRLNRQITLGANQSQSGIAQTAFQVEPYPIFWAVRNDGQLIGLVFNTQDQVYAWFRINMTTEGGYIESCAVISGQNQEDQLVLVVNRTINGVIQRFVEYFMPQEIFGQLSNAFFVHCGQQWSGGAAVPITGITQSNPTVVAALNHGFTNGMTVQIVGVQGMTQINQFAANQAYTISGVTSNTFNLVGMDSTGFSPYTVGGSVQQVANHVTGMSYLLGNEVVAVGDGAIILKSTLVTSDVVAFPYYANLITIGLPYKMTVQPTNPVLSSQAATSRGMPQKLNRVTLSLYEAMGGQCGTDLDHMYDINYGTGSMSQTPSLFTGEFTPDLDGDWTGESTFFVTQDDPLPFTLRGLVFRMSANQD